MSGTRRGRGDWGLGQGVQMAIVDGAEIRLARRAKACCARMCAMATAAVHPSAVIAETAEVGEGTRIWLFCHVQAGARIGRNCVLGQNVNVGPSVVIGDGVKVQNNVSIYEGVVVEDEVFLGPSCVFTNVKRPRAFIDRRGAFAQTVVRRGATVGANATVVCGVDLGAFCFVGAGAVVT